MKTLNVLIVAAAVIAGVIFYGGKTATAQNNETEENNALVDSLSGEEDLLDSNVVYESFYDSLNNKGDWMEIKKADFIKSIAGDAADIDKPFYSDEEVIYVWRPWGVMHNTWSPYTEGRWVFTTQGWVWVSDYDWGWAPYHYGRWWFYAGYGWVWIPGRIWAPNWVCWRESGVYVGWYPVGPRIWWRNHERVLIHNNVFVSYTNKWVFVDRKDFNEKITSEVRVKDNKEILRTSSRTALNKYEDGKFKYNGPDVKQISKSTGTNIEPKAIKHTKEKKNSSIEKEKVVTYKHDPPSRSENKKDNQSRGDEKNRFNTRPKTYIRPGRTDSNSKKE